MKTSPSSFRSRRLLPVAAVLVSLALGFAARVGAVPVPATVPQNNFPSPNLPPPTGIYVSTQNVFAVYANGVNANGVIVKDVSLLHPSASLPPPVLGGAPVTQNFDASVRMAISTDGGVTFSAVTAPAQASMRIRAAAFSTPQLYDTEMLALNIAGGTLPGGIMFRESPTRQSLGGTTVRQPSTGGAVIASFFDIFTELSVDGGATWLPAQQAGNVELRVDPTTFPPINTRTALLPPPNGVYVSPPDFQTAFAGGIVIKDIRHHFFTQSQPPPPQGAPPQVQVFDSQVDMQVSADGGATFQPRRAPAAAVMQVTVRPSFDGTNFYDTEMLALNIQGGDFPPGVMLRESPTLRSTGGTAIRALPPGDPDFDLLRINSFFDIFTEVSVDGGATWSPASVPARVVLQSPAAEVTGSSTNLPPPGNEYVSGAGATAIFPTGVPGVIIKDLKHDGFSLSQPPPPPGGTQIQTFDGFVQFRISLDGGTTFLPGRAPVQTTMRVTSSVDSGQTRFFDTEMLALNISGGSLPAGWLIRESPSKASLGRTSIRQGGGGAALTYSISSFFDIFTELSVDGGATWKPSASAPPEVLLAKPPTPHFFTEAKLPPPTGVYTAPSGSQTTYANGIIIKNASHKAFTQSVTPPPLGSTQTHSFGATVEMDLSSDGGATFQHFSTTVSGTERLTHFADDASASFFDTEMLALNISGGSLPAGTMLRESPTKQSLGRTTIRTTPGGALIDSFFDVFTEISLDGGASWSPAADSGHVELTVDPTLIVPVKAPTTLVPPPNDFYSGTGLLDAQFAPGLVIRHAKIHFFQFFPQQVPPPLPGVTQFQTFYSQADMELSNDGGVTFHPARVPALVTVRVTHTRDEGTAQIFDTEMLQLDLQGGDLPPGVMLRESPSKQSLGATAIKPPAAGDPDFDLLRIGSFFDIFTELSLNGGATWSPATGAPAHIELQCSAPEITEASPNLPPLSDEYASAASAMVTFASGIVIKDLHCDHFTQSQPPPPPGGFQNQATGLQAHFQLSTNGGATFTPRSAPAQAMFQISSSLDQDATRFFDTEMLQLDISGGTLPPGFMIRESPSKQSLGRTASRPGALGGDYRVSSFFDIFTEITLDGGATWQPALNGAVEVVLAKPVFAPIPHFFTSTNLPPQNGVDASGADPFGTYFAGSRIIRNVAHRAFTQSLPPPPLGGVQIHSFSSTVGMDVSNDGGLSFQRVTAPASVSFRVTHTSDDAVTSHYDTEMLQLDISGGSLPAGVMLRESPTLASTGKTSITPTAGGFMIGSFFDIFTEITLDGGATWSPSPNPGHVDLEVDPTVIPPITAPTTLLPPPNDVYASTSLADAQFVQGVVIRGIRHRFFTQSQVPPVLGAGQLQSFNSQVDMEVSTNNGLTFQKMRAPAAVSLQVTHTRDEGSTQIFDTEMLALNIQGGDLPAGIMLRESPTLRSQGGTAITPVPTTGTYRIDSFFDIFTELSVDGGATWSPASSAPAHHELQSSAPEITESSPNLPPLGDEYVSPPSYRAMFGSSFIFQEVKCDSFTQSQPPPPPGGTQVHQSNAVVHFRISTDGGKTYQPGAAPAAVTFRVSSTQDEGATRYFETEMLQLNISGGSLPAGMMLRESPSKQSLGRTSIRTAGTDFMTSSFFDIFTELSADGGQTWQPCSTGLMDLAVRHPIVIADSDSDGTPDAWMIANFGHAKGQAFDKSRATDDADGDGRTNLEEYLAGTDPINRDSRLSATFARQAANGLVQFGAVTGRRYSVECKQDLQLLNPWQVICTDLEGAGPVGVIITNPFTVQHRFYRVRVEVIPP